MRSIVVLKAIILGAFAIGLLLLGIFFEVLAGTLF